MFKDTGNIETGETDDSNATLDTFTTTIALH